MDQKFAVHVFLLVFVSIRANRLIGHSHLRNPIRSRINRCLAGYQLTEIGESPTESQQDIHTGSGVDRAADRIRWARDDQRRVVGRTLRVAEPDEAAAIRAALDS